jgi:hypothetical protein
MTKQGYGKIAGALGLLFLLSSPYTWILNQSALAAVTKAVVGTVLLAFYVLTHAGSLGQVASRKSSFFFASSAVLGFLVLAALVAVNVIAAKKDKSFDLTKNRIFTLAPQTQGVLRALTEPVRVVAFLPPQSSALDQVEGLLSRYHREAPERFSYAFKDPRKTPDLASKYELREGQTTLILAKGQGPKESHTAVNLLPEQILTEQEVTNALLKLSSTGAQKVYFLTGHGEWPLTKGDEPEQSLSELGKSLEQEGYTPAPLNLLAGKAMEVPQDAAVVVVAGARNPVSAGEEKALRAYLDRGGRVAVFAEAVVDGGLKALLAAYGVQVDPGILADDRATAGNPYLLLTNFYSEHELARSLKRLELIAELPTARGLTVLHEGLMDGVHVEPVLTTSPYAWEVAKPAEAPVRQDGDKTGSIPVVTATTRRTAEVKDKRFDEARLLVFGDAQLLVDANWGHEANRNLVLNALAWTTSQSAKITIRPPDRDISTLDVDGPVYERIRFVATDLLPFSLLGVGLVVWLQRRNR